MYHLVQFKLVFITLGEYKRINAMLNVAIYRLFVYDFK